MAIELKQALHKASKLERYMDPSLAEEYSGCEEYQTVPLAVMEPIVTAAESWQGLQWRQPGDAPVDTEVLLKMSNGRVAVGSRMETGSWSLLNRHSVGIYDANAVVGWIPLDALPKTP